MLDDSRAGALGEMIDRVMFEGKDLSLPLQYSNEAFADFIAGQVAGGADYGWPQHFFNKDGHREFYCVPGDLPCFDDNLNAVPADDKDRAAIGRTVTLLQDAFDGHGQPLGALVPGDADLWEPFNFIINPNQPPGPYEGFLVLVGSDGNNLDAPLPPNLAGYGQVGDTDLERVALPGSALRAYADYFADQLVLTGGGSVHNFDDTIIVTAVNAAMTSQAQNDWCERCRVLSLHRPGFRPANVRDMIQFCINDSTMFRDLGWVST